MGGSGEWKNKLYYGDNLDVMRQHIQDESIDLIYLDPPFKSNINYNLLFRADGLSPDEAQWTAFKDTWLWDEAAERALTELQNVPNPRLVGFLNALATSIARSPMLAYIVNMALRLLEMHRKLKTTGSLYLHCDPTASHYLRIILDCIFGERNFINEIIWKRSYGHGDSRKSMGRSHDVIFFYARSDKYLLNRFYHAHDPGYLETFFTHKDERGRYKLENLTSPNPRPNLIYDYKGWPPPAKGWRVRRELMEQLDKENRLYFPKKKGGRIKKKVYLSELPGQPMTDVWTDIRPLSAHDHERLGYPTQKPVSLMKRIIQASSNTGDLVCDPFAGCGTTIEAAQSLHRRWIGVDISPFAIQLIRKQRLEGVFPEILFGTDYIIDGLPTTLAGACLLAEQDKKGFEVWAVSLINGIPNEKKGADKGIDGRIIFKPDGKTSKFAVISVKAGKLKADDVRSLISVARREERASLGFGIFVTLQEPTTGMRADASSAGVTTINGKVYPLVQILTVAEILAGKGPRLPLIDQSASMKKAEWKDSKTQAELLEWENSEQ
jgi:site-specific DNA-methyltransferase (adenine-specific)